MRFDLEVVVQRGSVAESRHRLQCAVVDRDGGLVAGTTRADLVTMFRSSAKPFQLLPLVERGHAERLGFTDEQLAVMVSSHVGSRYHVELVTAILARLGLGPDDLACEVRKADMATADPSAPYFCEAEWVESKSTKFSRAWLRLESHGTPSG